MSVSSAPTIELDPELPDQVFGYWFGPDDHIPKVMEGRPTGAVLPPRGSSISGGRDLVCLDLVPVQGYWIVLSELGRYTYRHTSGLLLDEPWWFVPVASVVGRWPVKFKVAFSESLDPRSIAATYGLDAQRRARPDAPAVCLRLRRAAAK